MTPYNFLLANQDLSSQTRLSNKKARYQSTGRSFRVTKTFSQNLLSIESDRSISWFCSFQRHVEADLQKM